MDDQRPRRRVSRTRFKAATTVKVLLLDDVVTYGANGIVIGIYTDVTRMERDVCGHAETVCGACLPEWETDYALAIFDHGANGYRNSGCRCDLCREGERDRWREIRAASIDNNEMTENENRG